MSAARAILGGAAVLAGGVALLLAHDLRAWQSGVDRGDARYGAAPAAARWTAATWLPRDPALHVLALEDDLGLRAAERAFSVAAAAPVGYDNGQRRTRLRGLAELALSDTAVAGSPSQASRAGNLLGILAATGSDAQADAGDAEKRAADVFDAAIRADPTNEAAKFNLELMLRRVRVVGEREGAGGSSGDLGDALEGAGAGLPGSGY